MSALGVLVMQFGMPLLLDHVRSLLANHDDRRVCVSTYNFGHDAGVHDSQFVDPVDFESVVHDVPVVTGRPHPAGSHRVVDSGRVLHDDACPVGVAGELVVVARG